MTTLESVATAATWALMNLLAVLAVFDPGQSETATSITFAGAIHHNGQL